MHDPKLFINGKNVPVECHVIGRPIIHYADISDFVLWNQENKIELQFGSIGQNQFLGPYLDYPECEVPDMNKTTICSLLPILYSKSVVYEKAIDPDMPLRINLKKEQLPVIQSAIMIPDYFFPGQAVTVSVKMRQPKEEIETVMISLPYSDGQMTYNPDDQNWQIQYTPGGREGLIMDVAFLRVFAVAKNGNVSEPADIPVKWHFAR